MSSIIRINQKYRETLITYLHKIYPDKTDVYAKYCADTAIDVEDAQSLLVINNQNQIVGCHLFFETKAMIKGEERRVLWGHDTFLNPEFRNELGLEFVFEIASVKDQFGYGLSDVNRKIQKRMPMIAFIGNGMRKYCFFNPWVLWGGVKRIFCLSHIPSAMPETVAVKNRKFILCSSTSQMEFHNGGYWNRSNMDVDFIRDEAFMNHRFFFNPVHRYYVYASEQSDSYFVARPIIFKGFNALFVVDFRYDMSCPEMFDFIFDAAEKLSRQLHMGVMMFTTNDPLAEKRYATSKWCRTKYVDLIANKKNGVNSQSTMLVTAADSDGEFHK